MGMMDIASTMTAQYIRDIDVHNYSEKSALEYSIRVPWSKVERTLDLR